MTFCNNLIKTYPQDNIKKEPPVIGGGTGNVDKSIRDTERVFLPGNKSIGADINSKQD
jgi:hypothetical protein